MFRKAKDKHRMHQRTKLTDITAVAAMSATERHDKLTQIISIINARIGKRVVFYGCHGMNKQEEMVR